MRVVETSHQIRRPGPSVRVIACALIFAGSLSWAVAGDKMAFNSNLVSDGSDIVLSTLGSVGER